VDAPGTLVLAWQVPPKWHAWLFLGSQNSRSPDIAEASLTAHESAHLIDE
jgi:hypothetical protein